jgi:archaellum component FlaC
MTTKSPDDMSLEEVAERLKRAKEELGKALKELEDLEKKSGVDLEELEGHLEEVKEILDEVPPIRHYL